MKDIIAAIITSLGVIIGAFIGVNGIKKNKKNNPSVEFVSPNEDFKKVISCVDYIYMYTINSHILLNQVNIILEQNPQIMLNNVILLVRKKNNESEADEQILYTNISQWRVWVKKKRIKDLTIVAYDHDPDHYYTILGDKLVFCGQVLFDSNRPTGTSVDYSPLVFYNTDELGKQVIEGYKRHFENVVNRYKKNATLYDTKENIDLIKHKS